MTQHDKKQHDTTKWYGKYLYKIKYFKWQLQSNNNIASIFLKRKIIF